MLGALVSVGHTCVSRLAAHVVDPSWAAHHSLPAVHGWIVGAVGRASLVIGNTSVGSRAAPWVHWTGAVLHALGGTVLEGRIGTFMRALIPVGNAGSRHLAAHVVDCSGTAHHPLAAVHGWVVGAVEGTFLSKRNTSVRHCATLVVHRSGTVRHALSASCGENFRAGR